MKKLFTNYNLELDKNEKKLLTTFCKQVLKQTEADDKLFGENKAFNSIIQKLNSDGEAVKLTKDERTRLKHQLEENVRYLRKNSEKAWFLKKWLFGSMLKQYDNLLSNHFQG